MTNTNQILLLSNLLRDEAQKYQGMTTEQIKQKLNIQVNAKNTNYVIFNRIIENSKNKDKLKDLFNKCSCVIKTINLERNSLLKESMSLKTFKYVDLYNEKWESSELRNYFSSFLFVFVIFKKDFKESTLENIKVWKMPEYILERDIKETWLITKNLISQGKIVKYIDSRGRYITYFPTSSDTKYIHVRPHARNRDDTFPLPIADKCTGKNAFMKHSFWLNKNFVKKIVLEDKYYE